MSCSLDGYIYAGNCKGFFIFQSFQLLSTTASTKTSSTAFITPLNFNIVFLLNFLK